MKGLSRRAFGKNLLGVGALATALTFSPANAKAILCSDGTDLSEQIIPVFRTDYQLKHKNKISSISKKTKNEEERIVLEVNSMGSSILQLSKGLFTVKAIAELIEDAYSIDRSSAEKSVACFINYLHKEGFIVFVSENYLTEDEKKKGRGVNLLDKNNNKAKILYKDNKKVEIEF